MRILHVISGLDPQNGGPTTALIGLAKAQAAAGVNVTILATWKETTGLPVADELRSAGVTVTHVGPATGKLSRHPDLASVADREVGRAEVVHIHALWEQVQHDAAVAARRHKKPYIVRPCGMLDPWSLAQSRWKKKIFLAWRVRADLNGASALHFTSDTERDLCQPLKLKPQAIVAPNGLDLSEFAQLPPAGAFRSRYPRLADRRYLIFLSRLHHKKGLDLLIPAFAKAKLADTMLAIAGPDSDGYRAEVEKNIAQHGVADRVIFTGMLRGVEKIAALAEAELFVLPSYQENFGIAVIEALAAGTPVIVSDGVNIHGEITSAGVGAVVPIGGGSEAAVAGLASTLEQWIGDPALRETASGRSRAYVRERYDWQKIALRWAEHYARLAGDAAAMNAAASSLSFHR